MTTTRVPLHQRTLTDEQRQEIANREVERKRVAAIFQPTGNLNLPAIQLLIAWAEQDVQALGDFRLWGRWDQSHWSHATLSLDTATDEAISHLDKYGDKVLWDSEEAEDVLDKAILNGACQTAYCMAGQAVVQAGYKMIYDSPDLLDDNGLFASADQCAPTEPTGRFDRFGFPVMEVTDDRESISSVAQRILGLDMYQADQFFSGSNSIRDLKRYANQFAGQAGHHHPYPGMGTHHDD